MNKKQRIIRVIDYDPLWPDRFQKEAQIISEALTEQIERIHHIGSTAVPGMRAKPIIDILLKVKDVSVLDKYNTVMEKIGYVPRGEYGIPGRRFFQKGLFDRTHHIHAFNAGSYGIHRHIVFRDYLITHPLVAKEYGDLKARCADECGNSGDKYCDAKNSFVKCHEKIAIQWSSVSQVLKETQ